MASLKVHEGSVESEMFSRPRTAELGTNVVLLVRGKALNEYVVEIDVSSSELLKSDEGQTDKGLINGAVDSRSREARSSRCLRCFGCRTGSN